MDIIGSLVGPINKTLGGLRGQVPFTVRCLLLRCEMIKVLRKSIRDLILGGESDSAVVVPSTVVGWLVVRCFLECDSWNLGGEILIRNAVCVFSLV